jgi:DNA polymerase-1
MNRKKMRGVKMFLTIDGNSLINRAYYGIKPLRSAKGVCTNGITGFLNVYFKLRRTYNPKYTAVAFDMRGGSFRNKLYGEYKSTRKGMPDELAEQLPYLKEILRCMGVASAEREGYEGDDLLGTMSLAAAENDTECVIATGDRDFFQLINERIRVNMFKTGGDRLYTAETIAEQYGVKPEEMLEVKALMGDASDNIPGVAGVGEKTAFSLIQKYKTVEYIYDNLERLDITAGLRKKLAEGREKCFLSRELGKICRDAPISRDLRDYEQTEPNCAKLSEILTELGMSNMIKKLDISPLLI